MYLQDEARRATPAPEIAQQAYQTPAAPLFGKPTGSAASAESERQPAPPPLERQDTTILTMLHSMSLGHLVLGLLLAVSGVILEAVFHQPPFFGLAASGAILSACGVMSRLGSERQTTLYSPLAFYLLPYTDFVIVGLWLLLFGASGPILLFFAYVILSAALLLGRHHALALTVISGGAVVIISVGQQLNGSAPTIALPPSVALPLLLAFTAIALALVAYVGWLFSLHLDRFSEESARQSQELDQQQEDGDQWRQQLSQEVQALGQLVTHFLKGQRQTRIPATLDLLGQLTQPLNTLLDQGERLIYTATLAAHAQERIGELKFALERINNGDRAALQIFASPSKTPLDALNPTLSTICLQVCELQYSFQRARTEYQGGVNLLAELAMQRQSLSSTDSAISDLLARSNQSVLHLRALLEGDGPNKSMTSGALYSERPILREMELRARQQSAGLEMLRARLGQIQERVEVAEGELRHTLEGLEQTLKIPPGSRPLPRYPQISDREAPPKPARSITTGPLSSADFPPLPRRFTGPLSHPGHTPPPTSESGPQQMVHG